MDAMDQARQRHRRSSLKNEAPGKAFSLPGANRHFIFRYITGPESGVKRFLRSIFSAHNGSQFRGSNADHTATGNVPHA
ncbi:hypothetical protein UAJ10_22755 [Nitrospirillum sp. BR 11164]|uniref:hypothetical protein n=1 Tax=Nitrospirillum sp. BR 11164 TaxID=3104324 RepID=UPI002AFF80CE|nr:hypothetical protein [Nitrospirillum sp. BR 11164]MEA1651821.1 hypothetical protein [Nitrospirillum sp. BR 11164]